MWIVQKNKIWYNEAKWVSSKKASEKITTLHSDFGIDLTQEGGGKRQKTFKLKKHPLTTNC
jgi:hypothetical protein